MAIRLDLSSESIEELVAMSQQADRLLQIVNNSSQLKPHVGVAAITRTLSERIGMDKDDLRTLVVALLNFYQTKVRLKKTAQETADIVSANFRDLKTTDAEARQAEWNKGKEKIVEAVKLLNPDHPLVSSQKAFKVATSRQYQLVDMRIFTDIRPVFDEAGEKISQSVISYVLSLDYHDCHDHKIIQFTLDAEDITELKKLCDRAERKATILKKEFQSKSWQTTILREPQEKPVEG
jgi:hypothetical protein